MVDAPSARSPKIPKAQSGQLQRPDCSLVGGSAFPYRRSENILVQPVVIAELELGHIQREVFLADLVVSADNATLNQRPEALNRVRVDSADNVTVQAVADGLVGVALTLEPHVALMLVRGEQGNVRADHLPYKGLHGLRGHAVKAASDN